MAACPPRNGPGNHPFVVWSACFLWLISMITLSVSLLLFLYAGKTLDCTETKLINMFALLSGAVMLLTNLQMVYLIALDRKISLKSKVGFCPLWLCIALIVVINMAGTALCIRRMNMGEKVIQKHIAECMANYRSSRNHKRFIDNLQWSLKCCGLNSYKDWFTRDWYDKSGDYEWQPILPGRYFRTIEYTDSVPLSCCKSGSCIPNYLTELGTHSIHTDGCRYFVNRLIKLFVIVHIALFVLVILMELLFVIYVSKAKESRSRQRKLLLDDYNIRNILDKRENFPISSESNNDEESSA